ncbi:septum formation initiator family protein [Streptomyces sp. J2-1]|uniref:septum formation initiator family protein n=1 Tax=Streptomyces corallincola TaxID=2851888 RepID=UPI001C39103E|nr:septum formation initiator family protein [Streptomyces corallincola]MBV2355622.1 septum formation initiator family protein [Streptomyces corallincola]
MSGTPRMRGRAARLARLFPAGRARAARTPFVLLVVLLLGGGLIGLLVLNSALSEGSFALADLQKRTKSLTDEEQALQRDIDAYSSPGALQLRARELGMVPGGDPAFLGPGGTVQGSPSPAPPEPASLIAPPAPETLDPAAPSGTPGAPGSEPTATPTAPTTAPGGTPAPPGTPSAPVTAPSEALAPLTPQPPAPTTTPGR